MHRAGMEWGAELGLEVYLKGQCHMFEVSFVWGVVCARVGVGVCVLLGFNMTPWPMVIYHLCAGDICSPNGTGCAFKTLKGLIPRTDWNVGPTDAGLQIIRARAQRRFMHACKRLKVPHKIMPKENNSQQKKKKVGGKQIKCKQVKRLIKSE